MSANFWNTLPRPFFVMAPMADVTDPAYRRIIASCGKPDVMYTEFVSADGLFKGGEEVGKPGPGYNRLVQDLAFDESERPIVAQFFSRDLATMAAAAELGEALGFDGIDINMGCPDKNVCKQGAGAAMITDPEHAKRLVHATKEATRLPVSVKTRIGYTRVEIEEWVPTLLSTDPAVLTLHARTKKEMSKVPAQWEHVARAVEIRNEMGSDTLIVGNGDVTSIQHARELAAETGCDGVMLGRAIYGNPWLFANKERPLLGERLTTLIQHIELYDELLGDHKPLHIMKKHFKSYLKPAEGERIRTKALLQQLMEAATAGEAIAHITEYLTDNQRQQ